VFVVKVSESDESELVLGGTSGNTGVFLVTFRCDVFVCVVFWRTGKNVVILWFLFLMRMVSHFND
jgi:hypothetical protein